MSFLDNIITFISPQAAYKREAWRQGYEELRANYDAADNNRLNGPWRVLNESGEMTDRFSRDSVRARARDLERNSDMMNSVVGAYRRNIVGNGFSLQARTADEKLNDEIEALWKTWTKKRNCDVTSTQNFTQILRMVETRKKIDGGILIHKCYTGGGLLPFKLQCLEVDELDISQITPKSAKNKVVGGIEYNEYNKAEGYWIRQYSLDGYTVVNPIYVPAKDMIFIFTKGRPSQVREMSDMSPTITRIRDAQEFMTAVSVKQRIEACLSVFIKKATPTGTLGRGTISAEGRYDYDGKMLTPGMIKMLNPGDEIQTVNPSGQGADATSYIKLQQRLMGAGQGLSYESTSRDMSESNYSSARQGSIEDDMTYSEDREVLEEAMDEIYETFIISAVLTGNISVPDFWNNKEKYFAHEWIHAPKRWIDPLKESNANRTALQSGQKTFQQIAAENGKDWKEQLDDMAAVIKYGEENGINTEEIIYGRKTNEDK